MNAQIVYDTEAYIVTDLATNESWLLARVELCNGTACIIRGRETRLYKTTRRCMQAWRAIMDEVQAHGWSKILA